MDLYLKEGGDKPEYPKKTYDIQSKNQYPILLEVKIHCPARDQILTI